MGLPVVKLKQTVSGPLYASRPVVNAAEIIAWAAAQGFKSTLPPENMHVTVAFSRSPVDGARLLITAPVLTVWGGDRAVKPLGAEGAVVLAFTCQALQVRWNEYLMAGASWDWGTYQPHVTLTYSGAGVDLSKVEPFQGNILLGEETQAPLNVDKKDEYTEVAAR